MRKLGEETQLSWESMLLVVYSWFLDSVVSLLLLLPFSSFCGMWRMWPLRRRWEQNFSRHFLISLISFQITPMEALKSELKFALNFWIVTKPVHRNISENGNGSSRSRLHPESENHSLKESLNSIKVDNDKTNGSSNGLKSKSLLNLNKILDFGRQKHSAT